MQTVRYRLTSPNGSNKAEAKSLVAKMRQKLQIYLFLFFLLYITISNSSFTMPEICQKPTNI